MYLLDLLTEVLHLSLLKKVIDIERILCIILVLLNEVLLRYIRKVSRIDFNEFNHYNSSDYIFKADMIILNLKIALLLIK